MAVTRWLACHRALIKWMQAPGTESTVTLSVASTATLDLTCRNLQRRERHQRPTRPTSMGDGFRDHAAGSEDVRSGYHGLAAPDQYHTAGFAQLPRVCRRRARHGVHPERGRHHEPACWRPGQQRIERLHRWRRSEKLRAVRRRSPARTPARAIRSRSWRSPNTRSSPPTTRPSTTRFRAPRSRRKPSPAPMNSTVTCSVDFTDTAMRAETPAEQAADKKTSSHEKDYGFDWAVLSSRTWRTSTLPTKARNSIARSPWFLAGDASYIQPAAGKRAESARPCQPAVQGKRLVRQDRLRADRPRPLRDQRQVP
jgi:hypothetical protein